MQIVEDKALVLRTRKPEKYAVIPKSKVISEDENGYEVAVYWGLDEARVLKNLGVKNVPSPITRQYDWPGRHKPFNHQIETASFLTLNRRAFCFNDPGTGKTLATAGGAAGGAYLGNEIQKKVNSKKVWITSVRLKDGSTHQFEQESQPAWGVGQVVLVNGNALTRQ